MKRKRKPSDGRIWLTKHYHLAQFCQGRPAPHPLQVKKIYRLAETLEAAAQPKCMPLICEIVGDYDAIVYAFLGNDAPESLRGQSFRVELP